MKEMNVQRLPVAGNASPPAEGGVSLKRAPRFSHPHRRGIERGADGLKPDALTFDKVGRFILPLSRCPAAQQVQVAVETILHVSVNVGKHADVTRRDDPAVG
jgi:hypothetical protein